VQVRMQEQHLTRKDQNKEEEIKAKGEMSKRSA
jgi:hypothetical protein